MASTTELDEDKTGKKIDITSYIGIIGSLLYLNASRPNIMFATCLYARFQADPKESHLIAVKWIFKYLKGTPNIGIWYPKGTCFELVCYTDSDFVGRKIDQKSTSGNCSTSELSVGQFKVKILPSHLEDYCYGIDIAREFSSITYRWSHGDVFQIAKGEPTWNF
ncbi:putative mitochondrial protein AtMg00240 [Apium graveolens]|uniref:putative mitochondrial protein AtMg00240 n=1 Tax=Apium graveolens TaxID=4045 RepID=UPI003D7B177E